MRSVPSPLRVHATAIALGAGLLALTATATAVAIADLNGTMAASVTEQVGLIVAF